MNRLKCVALILLACGGLQGLFASLILDSTIPLTGIGLGAVPTVLTVRSLEDTASGCVAWNGVGDVIGSIACGTTGSAGGDEKAGGSLTLTRTITEAGVTSAAGLRVFLNTSEPKGSPVIINNLVVSIFDPSGATLFASGPFTTTITFSTTPPGAGRSGYVFRLDLIDLAAAPRSAFADPSNRIGLAATVTGRRGGNATFFVASDLFISPPGPPPAVPEPAVLFTSLSGLVVFGILLGRR